MSRNGLQSRGCHQIRWSSGRPVPSWVEGIKKRSSHSSGCIAFEPFNPRPQNRREQLQILPTVKLIEVVSWRGKKQRPARSGGKHVSVFTSVRDTGTAKPRGAGWSVVSLLHQMSPDVICVTLRQIAGDVLLPQISGTILEGGWIFSPIYGLQPITAEDKLYVKPKCSEKPLDGYLSPKWVSVHE